jgi:hypothetical protein
MIRLFIPVVDDIDDDRDHLGLDMPSRREVFTLEGDHWSRVHP